jgi:2,4-dichlorophenol 6-monooxygenase
MSFQAVFAPTPDGATRLARLREFLRTQRLEYQAHDIEIGYDYAASPIVTSDGSEPPPHDPFGTEHIQTARPGHRAPHAWFMSGERRVSTHGLLRPGVFLLLTGSDREAWRRAVRENAWEVGVEIDVRSVGPDSDLAAEDGWGAMRGHDESGALLIRPDGHVAMRAASGPVDHPQVLFDALSRALCPPAEAAQPA